MTPHGSGVAADAEWMQETGHRAGGTFETLNAMVLVVTLVVLVALPIGAWAVGASLGLGRGAGLVAVLVAGALTAFMPAFGLWRKGRIRRRAEDAARDARYEDTGMTPAHAGFEPRVRELEALGYGADCTTITPQGSPLVLMIHRDGSVATLVGHRGKVSVLISSCLVPGERWLRTAVAGNSHVGPVALVDGCGLRATPADLVERHRTVLAAFAQFGVCVAPVFRGTAADDNLARRRAMVGDPIAFEPRTGAAAATWPLLENPSLPAGIAEIRARQEQLGWVPTPTGEGGRHI